MPAAARLQEWLRAHPTAADALVGLLVLVPAVSARSPRSGSAFDFELTPLTTTLVVVGCASLSLRRLAPRAVWGLTLGLGLLGVLVVSGPSQVLFPAIVALYTVCTRESTATSLGALVVTAVVPVALILVVSEIAVTDALAFGLLPWSAAAAGSGFAVRNQRATVAALHERALQAERTRDEEAQRRVAEERLRIARELHDVVAHHVSVINVQSGVAAHLLRSDPAGAAEAIGHVREASGVVLGEVPGLLGLLRTGEEEHATSPAPRLAEAAELVETARRSGLHVTWTSTGTPVELPAGTDLTAYRVIQESLTNASRHGTGSARLCVDYDEHGCTIEVRNERGPGATGAPGPARHGLTGMEERVAAVGGTITAGPVGAREWVVRARLDARPAGVRP